jgi:hypothetical protein
MPIKGYRKYTQEQLTILFDAYKRMPLKEAAKVAGMTYRAAMWQVHQSGSGKAFGDISPAKEVALSEVQLAYIAGLIDGEGSIAVRKMRAGKVKPSVRIASTDTLLMDWLMSTLSGPSIYTTVSRKPKPGRLALLLYHIEGLTYLPLYEALLPYLVIKRERMELMIEWCEIRLGQTKTDPYTERQQFITQRIRLLNTRMSQRLPEDQ